MIELPGKEVGFTSPATEQKFSLRRTGIEMAAATGLAIALVIAVAAVSIGMARAHAFGGTSHHDGASLAIAAAGLSVVAAGWGGLSALVGRDTKLPPA
jgi:hypothetical protein